MFHDAPIGRITVTPGALDIETETFSFGPGERLPPGRIRLEGIGTIFRNDVPIPVFAIESDDGEIHHLHADADGVHLHIIWHRWTPKAEQVFATYRFPGARLAVEAMDGGPLRPVPEAPEHEER
ncbi:hypothetical protein ACLBXM_13660 [Xanthobacteraceae bacterium A53D]